MKQKYFINAHKGITFLAILAMMAIYDQWPNPTAWVYLALHGTYGILWLLKSWLFPDPQWEQPASPGYAIFLVGGLTLYWIAPWLITSQGVQAPPWYVAICISMYALGVFFHFASDMQKHTALELQPGLITDGFFGLSRNPNYFGELLIYLGFGLMAMHWAPVLVIAAAILVVWWPNMRKKDRSLSRYPEFEVYRERVKMFLPFLF